MKTTALSQSAKERGIKVFDWHIKNVEEFIHRLEVRPDRCDIHNVSIEKSKARLADFQELLAFIQTQ